MAVSVRIDSIAKDIEVFLKQDLGPQERSKVIAQFARSELHKGQEQNRRVLGHTPPHETFVDGVPGAIEERVRPDGRIVYEFELIGNALSWINEQLQRHSPVKSGRYVKSHELFADGAMIDNPDAAPPANEYVFLNTQPYSRKIEKGLSQQEPDGVYEAVAAVAKRRFGNLAKISFSYRAMAGGAGGSAAGASRRAHLGFKRAMIGGVERDQRTPAIVVTVR